MGTTLATTTHALIESIIGYGLATTGSHTRAEELRAIDTRFLHRAARRVAGTNITMRKETLMIMADLTSVVNQYVLKIANVLDRTLIAGGTAAQSHAWSAIQAQSGQKTQQEQPTPAEDYETVEWEMDRINILRTGSKKKPRRREIPRKRRKYMDGHKKESTQAR